MSDESENESNRTLEMMREDIENNRTAYAKMGNIDNVSEEETESDVESMFDHLCWYLVSTREGFFPPDETAEKALEDNTLQDMWGEKFTKGYHRGNFLLADDVADFIEQYDINVEERAARYAKENNLDRPKFRSELKLSSSE